MMKTYLPLLRSWCCLCLFFMSIQGLQAQISTANNDVFVIPAGDTLSMEGLGLYPSAALDLTGIGIEKYTSLLHPSANPHVTKVFRFSPNAPNFSGVIGFRYDDGELNGIAEENLQLNFFNTTWNSVNTNSIDASINYLVTNAASNILPIELTLASSLRALPLQWLNMQAKPIEKNVRVNWTTAQEDRVGAYTVMHSTDGTHWLALGSLPPQKHLYNQYEYNHSTPAIGKNYYRIQESGLDGSISLSKIAVVVHNMQAAAFQLFPNPSIPGTINLNLATNETIRIYQSNGVLVYAKTLVAGEHTIQTTHMKSGSYIVTNGKQSIIWVVQ